MDETWQFPLRHIPFSLLKNRHDLKRRRSRCDFCFLKLNSIVEIFTEKIRRKDLEVARALEEKHRLVSEYYQIPFLEAQTQPQEAENTTTSELDEAAAATRDAREVLLAALVQGEYN